MPRSDPTSTPAVPPDKVVIKVGDTQVTAADFDFLLHTLNAQEQKNVATQGRQPLAEQYILTLLLEQQGLRDHLDSTSDFRRQEAIERAQRLVRKHVKPATSLVDELIAERREAAREAAKDE